MKEIFSPNEQKVIKILGKKKMMISEIAKEMYKEHEIYYGTNNNVGNLIRRIVGKCIYNELTWTIEGEGMGRHGRKVWAVSK